MKQSTFITRLCRNATASVLVVSCLGYLLGDEVTSLSKLYALGKAGLSYASLFQLFLLSTFVTIYDQFFFHTECMENRRFLSKACGMFLLSGGTTAVFIALFDWFPMDETMGWIGFLISFFLCFAAAVTLMHLKEKREEERYNAYLKNAQREGRNHEGN